MLEHGDRSCIEALATCTTLASVTIPSATVIERHEGLVRQMHVYVDLAPLAAARISGT